MTDVTNTTSDLVRMVRKFAERNYESSGWDFVVESFSDEDIAGIIRKSRTINGALHRVGKACRALNANRAEIQATADEPAFPRLTPKELRVLCWMVASGRDVNGSTSPEELVSDNMTWASVTDLADALGIKRQSASALLASLERKGMVSNSGETPNGESGNVQWTATDAGIVRGWAA